MKTERLISGAFVAFDLATIGMLALGVGWGLGKRDLAVDLGAIVVAAMFGMGALGLLSARLRKLALFALGTAAVAGAVLFFVLVCTGSYLWGIYGPVGRGGGIAMFLLAMTSLAYLVVLPILHSAWLLHLQGTSSRRTSDASRRMSDASHRTLDAG